MKASTPSAPDLARTASTWSDAELIWIVKHGVKFTAMPAWPAQERDDEVRRMAAFVRRLPSMDPGEYRELAHGPGRVGGSLLSGRDDALPDCERCHAKNGRGQPDIPVLAGQKAGYLLAALQGFARGTRASGVMSAAAARIDAVTMRALAGHYAGLPGGLVETGVPTPAGYSGSADDELAGRIVERGLPDADLPPCSRCHAPGKHPRYPLLGGQKASYLASRLRRWRGEENIVEARKPNESMPTIARRIPEHMIEPLARYFERQSTGQSGKDASHRAGIASVQ